MIRQGGIYTHFVQFVPECFNYLIFDVTPSFQESKSGKVAFIKCHAPWDVLAKGAELMNMKMPLAVGLLFIDM